MKPINAFVLAATMLALPLAGAGAQQKADSMRHRPGAGMAMERSGAPDMAGHVLALRSELKLTDAQVSRLTAIQKKYAEKNTKLHEKLRSEMGTTARPRVVRPDSGARPTPGQRGEMRQRMQADREAFRKAHPALVETQKELRETAREMRKEVSAVLTEAQKAAIWDRMVMQPGHPGMRGHPGMDARRAPAGAPRS